MMLARVFGRTCPVAPELPAVGGSTATRPRPKRGNSKSEYFDSIVNADSDVNECALVYRGLSVTPKVFAPFVTYETDETAASSASSSSDVVNEERLRQFLHGRLELPWTLCNPFADKRLISSLWCVFSRTAIVVMVLTTLTYAVCAWTSNAAFVKEPVNVLIAGKDPPEACRSWRTSAQLKSLLLSLDVPFFLFLGLGYTCASANSLASSPSTYPLVSVFALEMVLVLIGSLFVAFKDPKWIWGEKGSLAFAGIWIIVLNLCGIFAMAFGLTAAHDADKRVVRRRISAARFALVLFTSASLLQTMFYFVEYLAGTGMHAAFGLCILFSVAFMSMSLIKFLMRQWMKMPTLAICFMLYWFQAGSYMSFRLYLQSEGDMHVFALTTLTAASLEIALRIGVVVIAKFAYNYYVKQGDHAMALRVLDIHVASVWVDILGEWAAIVVASVFGASVDDSIFEGLGASMQYADAFVGIVVLQCAMEIIADLTSLIIAFAILPVSLEGISMSDGHRLLEVSCIIVSMVFVFSMMNMRVRIDCFL
eukprot:TRINITY_DN30762_c0_g1_i1.p1 TRINITY_DN30762_c0_g1~~TRINITY_DN30762_c0_g1_i1.p1  ORF type:complete len:536 (-),score=65.08 TRINITY_DN30762_c0_g1_i1:139-1746(-)